MEKPVITHIVLTGGPCAGKTTMLSRMVEEFSEKGYKVIVVPETATELILSGLVPGGNSISMNYFQHFVIDKQLHKENLFIEAAEHMDADKIILVYDRGLMDGRAYVASDDDFETVLEQSGLTHVSAMNRYHAVIHLITAAKGAKEAYTKANNAARRETVEEAVDADDRTLAAWIGHPHVRVIDNSTGFDRKVQRAMNEVYSVLGEPVPLEIERKYLVYRPSVEQLEAVGAVKSEVVQVYLKSSDSNVERRIRQRGSNGHYTFYYTEKVDVSELEREERERQISRDEYVSLMTEADPEIPILTKDRYCFVYENQYFELDIYENSPDKALLEIELTDKASEVVLPDFLTVDKEVTSYVTYRNKAIAQRRGVL